MERHQFIWKLRTLFELKHFPSPADLTASLGITVGPVLTICRRNPFGGIIYMQSSSSKG